ncbi:unnamed protein product [Closterium sp. NIES-64]|nr:unnamed protein product [Closterium sp. NIES-64]
MADHLSPPWSHVCHVLQSLEQRRANCVVTVDDDSGATLTGSQLVADVACLARGLETFCGVAPGERVCIAALNSSAYVQWLLAVPAVGAILAPLNHRWSMGEAAAAVQQVGRTVLVVDAHMLPGGTTSCHPFLITPFPFPTSPSHPLPSSFKPREQSIGEAAAAVQQVRATVLVVDAHMLPWWAHLKPLCPSLRLGVLISEGPTATTPSSASSSSALSHTALILQSLAKLACAGYRHDDVSHVTLLKCRSHNTGTPKAAALSHTALISQSLAKLARAAYRHDDAAALSHTALISQSLAKLACAGYCHDDVSGVCGDMAM